MVEANVQAVRSVGDWRGCGGGKGESLELRVRGQGASIGGASWEGGVQWGSP